MRAHARAVQDWDGRARHAGDVALTHRARRGAAKAPVQDAHRARRPAQQLGVKQLDLRVVRKGVPGNVPGADRVLHVPHQLRAGAADAQPLRTVEKERQQPRLLEFDVERWYG